MHRAVSRALVVAVVLLAVVFVLALVSRERNGKATAHPVPPSNSAVIQVETIPVRVSGMTETVHAVGTLEANESVMIRPEVPGLIRRVLFTEGQAVEKGMVLIELDDSEVKAQVAQAAAERKMADLTYQRIKQLGVDRQVFVPQQQIDEAVSKLHAAEANHALYVARLEKTRIRAPFSGYVGIRRVSPGDYVHVGEDLVNLEDLRTLKMEFKVPEHHLHRLAPGQQVVVRTDADPNQPFSGQVYVLDPRVDASSRTVRARASVPNPEARLRPGMFAEADLILGRNEHALVIPEEAVVMQRDKPVVFRVDGQSARTAQVELGVREGGLVQVLHGLSAGEVVVRTGHHKLTDGALIAAKDPGRP